MYQSCFQMDKTRWQTIEYPNWKSCSSQMASDIRTFTVFIQQLSPVLEGTIRLDYKVMWTTQVFRCVQYTETCWSFCHLLQVWPRKGVLNNGFCPILGSAPEKWAICPTIRNLNNGQIVCPVFWPSEKCVIQKNLALLGLLFISSL